MYLNVARGVTVPTILPRRKDAARAGHAPGCVYREQDAGGEMDAVGQAGALLLRGDSGAKATVSTARPERARAD